MTASEETQLNGTEKRANRSQKGTSTDKMESPSCTILSKKWCKWPKTNQFMEWNAITLVARQSTPDSSVKLYSKTLFKLSLQVQITAQTSMENSAERCSDTEERLALGHTALSSNCTEPVCLTSQLTTRQARWKLTLGSDKRIWVSISKKEKINLANLVGSKKAIVWALKRRLI